MPAEFERHSGCWMLWPERTDNWRDGAKPAQAAFAAVAEAIAASEPVTIGVSAAQFQNARARLSSKVRLVEITQQRCVDPRLRADLRDRREGQAARRRLDLQRLGRPRRGAVFSLGSGR